MCFLPVIAGTLIVVAVVDPGKVVLNDAVLFSVSVSKLSP